MMRRLNAWVRDRPMRRRWSLWLELVVTLALAGLYATAQNAVMFALFALVALLCVPDIMSWDAAEYDRDREARANKQ